MERKAVSVEQIQDLDRRAINKYGVPSIALMENAGKASAIEIAKSLRTTMRPTVSVICGFGNNAGDGFVIARHLVNKGFGVKVFLIGNSENLKCDAFINYNVLKKCEYDIVECASQETIKRAIKESDLVVDAIFGVGLSREIKDPFKGIIEVINSNSKKIVSVDIPSGLDGTTGKIYGCCIKAKKTITFSFEKIGFNKRLGPDHIGRVVVVDIGIPKKLLDDIK